MYTNFLQALVILFFIIIGERVYPIFPFVFLYSLIDEFYVPAEASSIPLLVKKADLPVANSLIFATRQGALLIGFGLSGVLMRFLGQNNIVFLASVFLLIAAISVYFLPKDEPERKPINNVTKFWTELKLGYSFIVSKRIILFPLIMAVFFGAILASIGVSLPAIAKQIFLIDVKDAGPLVIFPLGIGALTAIWQMPKISRNKRKKDLILLGIKIELACLLFLALLLPFFGSFILPLGVIVAFCLGFGGLLVFIPNQTLLQENIPSKLRARIFGTIGFVTTVITFPFLLFSATFIDTVGIRPFLFATGLGLLAFLLFFKKAENMIVNEKNGVTSDGN